MKYLPLVLAGLLRRRSRTVWTVLSIATAFLVFGALDGARTGLDDALRSMTDQTELVSLSRISASARLPFAHLARIEGVPGVASADFYQPFGGYYREPRNRIGGSAIDPERYYNDPTPEFITTPELVTALAKTRTGALVGEDLARKQGWKIGDRFTIRAPGFIRKDRSIDWTFDVLGTYRREKGPAEAIRINYKYLDEARAVGVATVSGFRVRVKPGEASTGVAGRIDRLFANSGGETRTQSEADLVRSQINQLGDIDTAVTGIVAAVFFTLLFVAGNTMMESVRERIPELAVLKAYGYSDGRVAALVCAESLLLCVGGAVVGLAIVAAIFPPAYAAIGLVSRNIQPAVLGVGMALAIGLALLVALPPMLRVKRLTIIEALAVR